MDQIINDLLLNFLFLLFFLLFIPLILDQTNFPQSSKRKLMILSSCFAVITSITFPVINGGNDFIYDLRYVAIIAGGLYGGIPAIISIWITTVFYRIFFGGIGVIINIIIATILVALLMIILKKFQQSSKKIKLIIGSVFAFITSSLVWAAIGIAFNNVSIAHGLIFVITQTMAVFIIVYITEIMQENTRVKFRTEKMDLVSQLASSISHEVRNPLTVVRGFLQLMIQVDVSKEKKEEYLKIAISEIDRANNIIGDYLTFAKPSADKFEIMNSKLEIARATDVITPLANMNSVSIKTKIDLFWISGESQLFQQCLLNITKNCIEAMPYGGELTIETTKDKDMVEIRITDTGIGMTEAQLRRLGEPYFTTKGNNGTGLGMMTAIRIIENMNGNLQVMSQINKGSTFIIKLPLMNTPIDHDLQISLAR